MDRRLVSSSRGDGPGCGIGDFFRDVMDRSASSSWAYFLIDPRLMVSSSLTTRRLHNAARAADTSPVSMLVQLLRAP
jgi:hypothetical protein